MRMKTILASAMLAMLAVGGVAQAKETVIWWDFLGGGDGVRMKKLISDFNAEHKDSIEIQATTLDWGTPFYTKVQTSAAVGEGPDVMTYHASRIPLAVSQGTLSEITPEDMKIMGLSEASFAPAPWDAVHVDGKQYAVPFDTHPIVLYYNKDELAEAGLIGDNGLPKDLNGLDNFNAALKKLKDSGVKWPISNVTADGSFVFRTIYSLLCQQGGTIGSDGAWIAGDNAEKLAKSVGVIADWVKDGYTPVLHRLSLDRRPVHVRRRRADDQRRLGSPDDDRPQQGGQAVQLGRHRASGASSTSPAPIRTRTRFAIPNNVGNPQTPEKHAAVLEVIKWMEEHALFWATAGHIPANKAVTDSRRVQGDAAAGDLRAADRPHDLRPQVEVRGRRLAALRCRRQRLHRRDQRRGQPDRCRGRDEGYARQPPVRSLTRNDNGRR